MRNVWILRGEGIECEKESFRFFSSEQLNTKARYVNVPELLKEPQKLLHAMKEGDWVLFPGGFSYADHLGSGRLLSFKLNEAKVFDALLNLGVHMLGICNGFQILTAAGLFGKNVHLEKNSPAGFRNQWVRLKAWRNQDFFFTCRHGEGRLTVEGALESGVQGLMSYADPQFENGSYQKIAGLMRKYKKSYVFGLMPHPEISLRAIEGPDFVGGEFPDQFGKEAEARPGEGIKFFQDLQNDIEEGSL